MYGRFDTVKVKIKIGNLKLVRFIPQVLLLISRGVGRTITFYHTETHHLLEDEYVRIPSPSEKKAWLLKKTSAFEEIEKVCTYSVLHASILKWSEANYAVQDLVSKAG